MRGSDPLTLTLELARADKAGRPFDFKFEPQSYLLRSAGGGFQDATLPWGDALLDDLAAVRLPGRDPAVVQRLGERLHDFLAPTAWRTMEAEIRDAVRESRPVVVAIRSAAAELYALPWELLTIAATGQHIGELPGVLVRYEWPETETAPAPASPCAERFLLAWSGHVPASEHQASIATACRAGARAFDLQDDVLPHASCGQLSERLRSAAQVGRPITILHLLCHGTTAGTTFALALDGDEPSDGVVAVDAGRLRQILAPHAETLRLVVLAACDGGNTGAVGNQMGSVAQALHRAGIAGVVASRFPLSTSGANRMVRALYGELVGRSSGLHQAFLTARAHVAEDARQLDWASLQLYARGDRDAETIATDDASPAARRSAELREELSRFRALFSGTPGQIALLGRYKALHDALQELEVPFNVIVRDQGRLLASPEAWDELRDPLESLQMMVEKTLSLMDVERLRDGFESSRRWLLATKQLLDTAMAGDAKQLDVAIHHVRRVLNLDTSSANTRLLMTARELRLSEVAAALRSVVDNLERRGATIGLLGVLHRLVVSLDELRAALEGLLNEHDQWQAISNDLRHLADAGQSTLSEIRLSWPLVHGSLKALLASSADWTRPIDIAAQALDNAVGGGDARKCTACLRNLYRRSNQRFVDVDKRLLQTCEALQGVGATLDSVLQVIDEQW
jgi:hypothetical protein